MSSLPRRIQRKKLRQSPDYEPAPQPTVMLKDGGYKTLGRRGWVYISARRLEAQRRLAELLDHVILPRAKKPAKVWRKPAKEWPSTVTRQQRRRAQQTGRPLEV